MFKELLNSSFSKKVFLFGIFFLPSAPAFSIFFLLFSSLISIKNNYKDLLLDKLNLVFISAGLLMPIICLQQSSEIIPLKDNWDKSLTWIGLINWLPLIFCFLAFQYLIRNTSDRKIVSQVLIAGSFPVLFSGFAQYIFKIYGPFELLNGLIIWFQKPLQQDTGMSALFSNQNYAGAWFCIIWPLCLASFLDSLNKKFDKYISLSFLLAVTVALVLTTSRSAWGGLIMLIPLMINVPSKFFLITLICLLLIFGLSSVFNFIPSDFQISLKNIIPNRLVMEFSPENFSGRETRPEIWYKAIEFIFKRPFLGWGAASFPILYFYSNKVYAGHTHNLILELALSYGIPITFLIFSSIFIIFTFSFSKIFINKSYLNTDLYERAWFSSFFVLLCTQLVDIQYFDGRVSLIFWILLAGLKQGF